MTNVLNTVDKKSLQGGLLKLTGIFPKRQVGFPSILQWTGTRNKHTYFQRVCSILNKTSFFIVPSAAKRLIRKLLSDIREQRCRGFF